MGIVGHAIAATLKHVSTLNSNSSSCKFRNARSKQHHSAFGHGLCSNLPANDDAAWCCDFAGLFHQQADVGNNCLTRRGLKSKSSESIYMRIKHVKHDETTYHILICVDSCNILAYCIILRTLLMPPQCESPLGSAWTQAAMKSMMPTATAMAAATALSWLDAMRSPAQTQSPKILSYTCRYLIYGFTMYVYIYIDT